MLVCWRGVYLSLRSSTQTCTYIKDKNKKKNASRRYGTRSIHRKTKESETITHYLPRLGHDSPLLLPLSCFLPPPQDIRASANPSYPPPPLCHLSTRPSGGSQRRWGETCLSHAQESTAAWRVCFPCLQTCCHSSPHYHGGEEQWMGEGRLHRLQSAPCCCFFFLRIAYHISVSVCCTASSVKSYSELTSQSDDGGVNHELELAGQWLGIDFPY